MHPIRAIVDFLGRCCIAVLFIITAMQKVSDWNGTIEFMRANGLTTATELLCGLAIIIEFFGGVALVLGWRICSVSVILALYLIPVTYSIHHFWNMAPPEAAAQSVQFLNNLAIFGGLLCLAASNRSRHISTSKAPE